MLALIYLGLAIALGDLLCRGFYRFVSTAHRWAAAILVGILLSTWFTYLAGVAFAHTGDPLLAADVLFFVLAPGAVFWLSRKAPKVSTIAARAPGSSAADWITLVALCFAACVLLIGTLYLNKQGRIRVFGMEATYFALQSAIAQSIALGHNFPPEWPYYSGQPLRYDFLFYLQAGNLEFLGLNLGWSVDVLSVLGLTSMLALVMALGELLFNSRVVGRVGTVLFFFSGSLAFISFPGSQGTATWTQIGFVNQRHLPGAIGVFLLVLIFLVDHYWQSRSQIRGTANQTANMDASVQYQQKSAFPTGFATAANKTFGSGSGFILSGLVLGALPLWNTSVFVGAAVVLLLLLILFPYRLQVMLLGITTAVLALPQLIYLRLAPGKWPLFYQGAIVSSPTLTKFISYIASTVGAKWLLLAAALILACRFRCRFFIALGSLLLLALWMELSNETLAVHNFLNIWIVVANLFVAYGLWRLSKLRGLPVLGPLAATLLAAFIVAGGIVDLFAIRDGSYAEVNYEKNDLVRWLGKNTKPNDVFLTNIFPSNPVLLAGRRIFFGSHDSPTEFDFDKRKSIYRQMFESKNPRRVFELLKQNHIDYVVFDDRVRYGELITNPNELIYSNYFHKVYEDVENRYGKLVIYKVPEALPASVGDIDLSEPAVSCFQGGQGTVEGQFNNPHGLTLDSAGNIFIADTGNGRIQKFSPNGSFVTSMGQFEAPNGIAIDPAGNIYVAEIGSNSSVQKLGPDGRFIAKWAPGLYGPRKVVIGPDNFIYVVDSGRNRIVKFSLDGQVLTTWGSEGTDDGQFNGVSSVAVDLTTNKVYVADPFNRRIQVFDSTGRFLTKWLVPEWGQPLGFEDLAIDPDRDHLYASSAHMNIILVFDLQGNRIGTLAPTPPDKLKGPSGLALTKDKLFVLNTGAARVTVIPLPEQISAKPR